MLADERHQIIISKLKQQGTIKLTELIEELHVSEATLRRDLAQLEKMKLLKRVHGGAALLQRKGFELGIHEKVHQFLAEKQEIASMAASYINEGDCIYLDAGTTVSELIPYLKEKNVTVLTNGLMHFPSLAEYEIKTMIVGGQVKVSTNAIIGSTAVSFLSQYRFDKCFLGMNGIHSQLGLTTPDPEEALLKKTAMQLSSECYVLADSSKLNEATFAKVGDITDAVIITDSNNQSALEEIRKNSKIKVVTP
ncbi:DeoR family fructose operon transcriptional repressor [Peribacillus deserti]|uniref:DeoR family fructose operon transcriptional repressor n=1 Tax=Peribacillus deserti TaxID=673318 RepID=A0ABS2QN08_9BACI|nr:DeoR/GlpR family DNA-binding transcription regulator [Peribacillus deserti]MBM7694543.1 DeoR family fructose operon transcriptional repressor [Peribacillus deserti]